METNRAVKISKIWIGLSKGEWISYVMDMENFTMITLCKIELEHNYGIHSTHGMMNAWKHVEVMIKIVYVS